MAFEDQVIGLLDDLLGAAMRLAKNRQDAEDLVAESVAKAWASRRSLHDPARFRAWLFRILTNVFISECRKRGARPKADVSLDAPGDTEGAFSLFEELHQPFLLWWGNPEQEFLNKLLRRDIERAVDALPEAFRMVVVLADMEGFSYQEIGRMLGVPIGTVRSRLARARSHLQKALWVHAKETPLDHRSHEACHEAGQDDRM
ncbi:MAG TPA: sigma-70 family RNA polymerase sigma factor [Nitrospiria bacterium]|nr:sigma-70 family RNA polymerase sigma factor [Nitrospiria bacterium]